MPRCSHCGFESPERDTCPLCGGGLVPSGGQPEQGGDAAPPRVDLPAWEDPRSGFPRNLFDTWVTSVLEPGRFFAGVPYERPAARPVLYYLIIGVASAFFWLWWSAVFSTVRLPVLSGWADLGYPTTPGTDGSAAPGALLNFFLAPFTAIVSLIVWSLFVHLFVLMLARERRDLKATVRTICYAAGPSLMAVVPLIGWMVGGVWTMVLTVIGVREAHRMSTGGAAAAVLLAFFLPMAALVALLMVLLLVAASVAV